MVRFQCQSCITCQLFAYFIYFGILTCFVINVQNKAENEHKKVKIQKLEQKRNPASRWRMPAVAESHPESSKTFPPPLDLFARSSPSSNLFSGDSEVRSGRSIQPFSSYLKDLRVGTMIISIGVLWQNYGKVAHCFQIAKFRGEVP